jgi:hypothetical protein
MYVRVCAYICTVCAYVIIFSILETIPRSADTLRLLNPEEEGRAVFRNVSKYY